MDSRWCQEFVIVAPTNGSILFAFLGSQMPNRSTSDFSLRQQCSQFPRDIGLQLGATAKGLFQPPCKILDAETSNTRTIMLAQPLQEPSFTSALRTVIRSKGATMSTRAKRTSLQPAEQPRKQPEIITGTQRQRRAWSLRGSWSY